MAITRDKINLDLSKKLSAQGLKANAIEEFQSLKETKLVNNATVLGKSVGQVVNGFESLENKLDFSGDVNTTGDVVTRITQNVAGYGVLTDLNDITLTLPNNGYDSDALQSDINTLLNADSDTNLLGMFSSVGSIGGGVADTVANVIKLITLLGALSKFTTNISISGSATGAISAAGKAVASKAAGIAGSISGAVGNLGALANVSSLTELTGAVSNFGQNISGVVGAVSAVKNFNPLAGAVGLVTNEIGLGRTIGGIGDALGGIDRGVNDITRTIGNIAENGLGAVTGAVLGKVGNILGPVNNTLITSAGGVIQNVNEAFNQPFAQNIIRLAGGAVVSANAVSSLMDKVTSNDPRQIAQAAQTIGGINNRIPDSMKSIISGISENSYNSSRELVDNILDRALRDNIPQADIDRFLSEFKNIEDTIPTLDTTVQSTLLRTTNQFFAQSVNLKDYTSDYPAVGSGGGTTGSGVSSGQETPQFTTVDSKEELGQEIMLTKRGILYLTIHSTESFNNQYLTSVDIHRDHIDRGFEGIQYHYVIRRDGILERGMPSDRVSQASPRILRNFTVDIALVGGINAPSGVENPDQYKSIEAYTRAQMDTLESFIDSFYRRYPGGIVQGHYQIEDTVQDPNFDVPKYIKNRFGKLSILGSTKDLVLPKDILSSKTDLIRSSDLNVISE